MAPSGLRASVVKTRPYLGAVAAETKVLARTLPEPRVGPVGEDALVGAAELAGAGQHATAVDEHRKAERLAVFQRHGLGGELGRAIERDRRQGGEGFVEA